MKDYRDMLSSLKDKVVGAAGKATVAVTDAAGKVSETVTDAANKVVSDEMRDKVAGAAHAVGDRAKYASRMAHLTVNCNAELERIKRTYTEIGRLYYENYRDTADAFLADLCQQVTDANARVAELEAQMDELQRRQAEFDDITARMDEGLVLFSGKGMILFANHAARALFPHDSAEGSYLTLGRDANYIQVVEQALDGKGAHGKLERNGRIYELTASSVEENSAWHAAVLLIVDITERERAEQQRQEFTANVSHELKTPLTSIMGYAEIIAGGIAKPEDIAPFAGKIRTEAQRLLALIEDIIHLSRLDEGGETVAFEPVELSALCDTVRGRLQSKAAGKGITLRIEGEPAAVSGQRRTLEQMIFNLTDNAINYNKPQGSVTLTTGTESGRPFVRVADTGIGIAPADQQRVFERFYRVDKSHSRMTGGTGLGLSIVKHGAALHHAEVELKSALGKGTCITLRFPKE